MLRAYVIEFKGNWIEYLPLVEFAYKNSYHASIRMSTYIAFYGRPCRSLMSWVEGIGFQYNESWSY